MIPTPSKKKTQETELFAEPIETPRAKINTSATEIKVRLEHIKSREGVIGYIIRASTSASVDVKDPSKIIEYATLSAATFESGEILSREFSLGGIKSIVLEGKDAKTLSMKTGEQKLSVFMEKSTNHNQIYQDLA